ncbi:cutinase family protein [Mycolicibacterium thermoresistibile]
MTALAGAAVVAGAAMITTALASGTATAAPDCPDVHWIGAAGSGERDGDLTADAGMGRTVYQSFREFQQRAHDDGRTVTAEAVEYPAVPVPGEGEVLAWGGFLGSVRTGAEALGTQYASFVQRCPDTKVVLAGYSQGAMVVHRNLHGLAASPNFAGALLVADGDRLPGDTTVDMGTAAAVSRTSMGVAQDWPILAGPPTTPLPPAVGARTISVCDVGDPVCDYDPEAESAMTPEAVAIHTSYVSGQRDSLPWSGPLYQLLGPAPESVHLTAADS